MQIKCTQCGSADLDEGFVADQGRGSKLFAKWIAGPLRLGVLGVAKTRGRPRAAIVAFRCKGCSHLELFATQIPI